MNETKSPAPTPEQLLQMLDLQLEMQRRRRQNKAGSRTAARIAGIVLLLAGCLAAFAALHFALSELPARTGENAAAKEGAEVAAEKF